MYKPVLDIIPAPMDRLWQYAAWMLLLLLWGISIYYAGSLPERIPIHFNWKGEADGYGSRTLFWLIPFLGTVLFLLMTRVLMIPHQYNYLVQINADNARYQYSLALRLIRYLRLAIMVLFCAIQCSVVGAALSKPGLLTHWIAPGTLGMILIPLILYIYLSVRK